MITYNWTITDLQTIDKPSSPDHVVFAKVLIEASDGPYNAELEYAVHFPSNSGEDFVAYSNLTQETILNWIESTLGESWIKIVYRDLTNKINMQRNPPDKPVSKPLPW